MFEWLINLINPSANQIYTLMSPVHNLGLKTNNLIITFHRIIRLKETYNVLKYVIYIICTVCYKHLIVDVYISVNQGEL